VKKRLKRSMSVEAFDRGYWYALEIKAFAKDLGIPSATKLRKDELEAAIRSFLATGKFAAPKRTTQRAGPVDSAKPLTLDRRVVTYNNDARTKSFLEREAKKLNPAYRRRSGARYRLNRWREEQLSHGRPITYRDLVREYVRLSTAPQPFAKIPVGRYINFLAAFLKAEPNATHAATRAAWHRLKRADVPKTYVGWKSLAR
jgi:hypothetical protein